MSPSPDPAPGRYWNPHPYRSFLLGRFAPSWGNGDLRRRIFPSIWLVYLIPLVTGFGHLHSVPFLAAAVALVLVFGAVFFVVVGWWWDRRPRLALAAVALLAGLAALACFVYGKGAAPIWIYVAVACGIAVVTQWLAMRAIAGAAACYTAFTLTSHVTTAGFFLGGLLPLLFGGLAAVGFRARFELTQELTVAKQTVALLAASEERLRLARDMHDLTGQSLSMITLKSDLAARMLDRLPASPERDRAAAEIAQVADVSRQALADMREAISGYRRPTLAVEAITARTALEAAGITAHDETALTLTSGTFDPDSEAVLAWCLREAITNVVRHSSARNCWVTLRRAPGEFILQVRDDGRGVTAATADALTGAGSAGHAGLRGMSERLSAAGGRLEIRPGAGGFCVAATVPASAPAVEGALR